MRDNKRDVSQLVELQESLKASKTNFTDEKVEQMPVEDLKLQVMQHQKMHDQIIKLVMAIKQDAGTMETHLKEVETAIQQNKIAQDVDNMQWK